MTGDEGVPGGIDDETVMVPRVGAQPEPQPAAQPDDETIVVVRKPVEPVEPDDETIVVVREPLAAGDETVVVVRTLAEPDDATVVSPRRAAADEETAVVYRKPRSEPVGPGEIPGGRQAIVPGDSTGRLAERYSIRAEVTSAPTALHRQNFEPAPDRHARPRVDPRERVAAAGRRRGILVVVSVVGVTIVTAAIIGLVVLLIGR